MKYQWVVYFAGPKTKWTGTVDESETLAFGEAPWRWLARATARGVYRSLDSRKCGWVLLQDGAQIERWTPTAVPEPVAAA